MLNPVRPACRLRPYRRSHAPSEAGRPSGPAAGVSGAPRAPAQALRSRVVRTTGGAVVAIDAGAVAADTHSDIRVGVAPARAV